MIITITYPTLEAAAEAWGNKKAFTSEGWQFLENYMNSYMREDEMLAFNSDMEIIYYEYPLSDFAGAEELGINEEKILEWLRDNDYIIGSYKVTDYSTFPATEQTYVMSYRDAGEPIYGEFLADVETL